MEYNGGVIQAVLDLTRDGSTLDATSCTASRIVAKGNEEKYGLHLPRQTLRDRRQRYRAHFTISTDWTLIELPFSEFLTLRIDLSINTTELGHLGLVAISRPFYSDLSVKRLRFYR